MGGRGPKASLFDGNRLPEARETSLSDENRLSEERETTLLTLELCISESRSHLQTQRVRQSSSSCLSCTSSSSCSSMREDHLTPRPCPLAFLAAVFAVLALPPAEALINWHATMTQMTAASLKNMHGVLHIASGMLCVEGRCGIRVDAAA